MKNLSTEQLAGRLVIGRLPGLVLDEEHRLALNQGILGGITLFKENASDLKQLCTLTKAIVDACMHSPVLTVDQEGGAVQRFDHVLTPLPSPMALAAINDTKCTSEITAISCRQLKTLGFNLLLAPTLDLLTNPLNPVIATRAFSSETGLTSSMGREVIEQIEASKLVACPKHFPGHGSTSQDSHLELAIVDKSNDELAAYDLAPFAANIKAMQSILIGHIWLPQLEQQQRPATLSPLIVTNILRHELGFDGLAISDDMTMHAITKAYGLGEACVMAIEAGVDLILVCGTFSQSQEAVQAIAQAIASGRISQERLAQCLERLDKLFNKRPATLDADNKQELAAFAKVIEKDTITSTKFSTTSAAVMKGSDHCNWQGQELTVVAPQHPRYKLPLAAELEGQGISVDELRYSLNPNHGEIASVCANLKGSKKRILYVTFRAFINSGQIELAQELAKLQAPELVHIAADTPYDILKMPEAVSTSLATFDPSDQALAGIAQIIAGKTRAQGKCPVVLAAGDKGL